MKTTVIFRKFDDNEILALFPDIPDTPGNCMSYMQVGQHGGANFQHCISITKPATPIEYQALMNELTNDVGYILDIKEQYNV